MNVPERKTPRPRAGPILLVLLAATHLAYLPTADWLGTPRLQWALILSLALGVAYTFAAAVLRQRADLRVASAVTVGEDAGVLAAGLVWGYPWALYLLPAAMIVLALQLAVAFAEIVRRQEVRRPLAPATRLAWFVVFSALALAAYVAFKPGGLLDAPSL